MIRHCHPGPGRPRAAGAALLLALLLAGCASGARQGAVAPASGAAPREDDSWQGRGRIRSAIAALTRGDAAAARRDLMAALRRQPSDAVARQLLAQIDTDPRVLLGTEYYSYTLRPGETLSTVAQRALGNPMLFYALARYNNIAVPTSVVPGQTILVPGRRPAPPRPAPRPAAPRPASPTPAPAPAPSPAPAAPAPRPAAPAVNPAPAARLRGQGLAAMNAGAIDRAVGLLSRASALDPGNAAIAADLARARRVQATVRARH